MPTRGEWQARFGRCIHADQCVFDPGCELYAASCARFANPACAYCHTQIRRRTFRRHRWQHITRTAAIWCALLGRRGPVRPERQTREPHPL